MKIPTRLLMVFLFLGASATAAVYSLVTSTTFSLIRDFSLTSPESVLFVGDVMMARSVEKSIDAKGADALLSGVKELHASSRYVVANFEAAIPEKHVSTPDFTFHFSVNKEHLPLLSDAHITHASLANNHAFDHGVSAYDYGYTALQAVGVTPFGNPAAVTASSTTSFILNDISVGIIGLHTVFTEPSRRDVADALSALSSTTDIQIAYVHWGTEYERQHSPTQEAYARFLIENGVDAIVGHHPHVIQDVARIDGVPIFYSLGNYVFDQYWSEDVTTGLAVRMTPLDSSIAFELIPIRIDRTIPRLATEEETTRILGEVAAYSKVELQNEIVAGVVTVPRK